MGVFASSSLDEVKLVAIDLLVMLNRKFVPRGVEFVLADAAGDATGDDIAVVLYWRRFGEYTEEEFRMAMKGMRNRQRPRNVVSLQMLRKGGIT